MAGMKMKDAEHFKGATISHNRYPIQKLRGMMNMTSPIQAIFFGRVRLRECLMN